MAVVKADGYGHGLAESAQGRPRGRRRLARRRHHRRGPRAPRGRRHRTGALLAHRPRRRLGRGDRAGRRRDRLLRGRAGRGRSPPDRRARVQIKVDTGLNRGGAPRRRWRDLFAAASGHGRTTGAGRHRHLVALLLQRRAGRPGQRRPGGGVPGRPRPGRRAPGCELEVRAPRQLRGRDPAAELQARPGAGRHRVVRPRPGARRHRRHRAAAGDDGPSQPRHGQARRRRRCGLLRPHLGRRPPDHARPGARPGTPTGSRGSAATAPRSRSPGGDAGSAAGSAWTSSSSTSTATTPAPGPR